MTHYYLDSSALVKRYVAEIGSRWVNTLFAIGSGHTVYTVRLSGAEVVAALSARARDGTLLSSNAQAAIMQFKSEFRGGYQIIEVNRHLVDTAMALTERHGLRGYDAVQLASAVEVQVRRIAHNLSEPVFVCADNQLNSAALAEGLTIENPNNYP